MGKIVLDNIAFSSQKSGGISVVWKNLIESIMDKRPDDLYCIEYPLAEQNICRKELNITNIDRRKPRFSFYIERRLLDPIVNFTRPFIFHSSYYRVCHNKNAINVTTVHDFTYELFGSGMGKFFHSTQKFRAIRKADVVVCITENTKNDLLKFLPDINPDKIRVIYNGVSESFFPIKKKPENKYGKYVLFIGRREDYKNFKLTVESIQGLDYNLAIVGPPLDKDEISYLNKQLGENRYYSFIRINDKNLNDLYNNAYCLAYPSRYEGFGLPILEAQRAGCPVIAYNSSSIPEVIGENPLLLENLKVETFRAKLRLLEHEKTRNQVIKTGYLNANKYSWTKMGSDYLKLYQELENSML